MKNKYLLGLLAILLLIGVYLFFPVHREARTGATAPLPSPQAAGAVAGPDGDADRTGAIEVAALMRSASG